MVRGHIVGPQSLGQQVSQPLGHAPGVDEDQRGPVLAYLGGDEVHHLAELLGRRHRVELAAREAQRHAQRTPVPAVDHGGRPTGSDPGQEPGNALDGPLGGRQTDALGPGADLEMVQPLQGQGQVRPPLVSGQGVDLVDDDRLHLAQGAAAAPRGRQEVQALGCRDQEGRRTTHHGGSGTGWGVPCPDPHGDVRRGQPELGGYSGNLGQRLLQVLMDVDGEGLQRGHVDHRSGLADVPPLVEGPIQGVNGHQETGQGLARAGRGRDQSVPTGSNMWPTVSLRG